MLLSVLPLIEDWTTRKQILLSSLNHLRNDILYWKGLTPSNLNSTQLAYSVMYFNKYHSEYVKLLSSHGVESCDCDHCTTDRHRGMPQPSTSTVESVHPLIELMQQHNIPSNCDCLHCNENRDNWPLCGCDTCTTAQFILRHPNQPGPSRIIETRRDLNIPWLPVNGPRRWNCQSPSSSSGESDED
ncbi:hypothetical protein JTB14_011658 [Gonioctena quinquepunctata]|nr:hypothetical protein JTB14_011658 [Gonioctena quinquepunctata]